MKKTSALKIEMGSGAIFKELGMFGVNKIAIDVLFCIYYHKYMEY